MITVPPHTRCLISVSEQPFKEPLHVMAFLHAVQAQDTAVCRGQVGCIGTDLGVLTPRECCVQNENGFSYRVQGQEICIPCVGKCTKTLSFVHAMDG